MEQKKEKKSIAEYAKKNAIDYIKNKYPSTDTEYILHLFESGGDLPDYLKKEYEKKYDEEIKKLENKNDDTENQKKQLEEKNKKIEELTDTLKRLQAEFENYKKRTEKEKIEFMKYAHADVIANILPVLDSFEIALKSLKIKDFQDTKNPSVVSEFARAHSHSKDFLVNTNDKEKFVEGIKIIYAQLYSLLESFGLKPIKATGEKFDPYKHEVLMNEESDKPEDTILEEFQKGYMLNDRVLRHSKVKVSGK